MTKPTPAEVKEYAKTIDFDLDGEGFVDFYQSKGWLVGKSPMKDWQAAVRTWKRKDVKKTTAKTKLFPIPGKVCGERGCNMPAVYKNGKSGYDHYYCGEHMPDKVKETYCV